MLTTLATSTLTNISTFYVFSVDPSVLSISLSYCKRIAYRKILIVDRAEKEEGIQGKGVGDRGGD